ncbi:hypothetical protein QIS99_03725 [Streptomyces sp. B-S-A8]|uniref:Uncharacterized protein n=1 Tax=Streptomyces solicavernae TaxID=3043614 RepID=A0ABT6RNJ3_9ACTN|nr:hypothetical protein [Streptomyces sp. B-S-A8]MDI3385328.1 hypothetical protein [Streptomyces sp. B-S-A8]
MSQKTRAQDPSTPASGERRQGPIPQSELAVWIVAILGSWFILVFSLLQHRHQWLTGVNVIAVHLGLFTLLNAGRLGRPGLARAARIVPAVTLAASVAALAFVR